MTPDGVYRQSQHVRMFNAEYGIAICACVLRMFTSTSYLCCLPSLGTVGGGSHIARPPFHPGGSGSGNYYVRYVSLVAGGGRSKSPVVFTKSKLRHLASSY